MGRDGTGKAGRREAKEVSDLAHPRSSSDLSDKPVSGDFRAGYGYFERTVGIG